MISWGNIIEGFIMAIPFLMICGPYTYYWIRHYGSRWEYVDEKWKEMDIKFENRWLETIKRLDAKTDATNSRLDALYSELISLRKEMR